MSYADNNPASFVEFLRSQISDAAVNRMKHRAGAPRIESKTGPNEVRALYYAILRVLLRDSLQLMEGKRTRTLTLLNFQQALKLIRDWRYYA